MEKIIFIVNPVSGKGNGRRLMQSISKNTLTSAEPVAFFTSGKGDAVKFVKDGLKGGFRKFVAVGGDGTVNEVASALVHTNGVLGIIPNGSGNGLSRHLKIPGRVSDALNIISEGNVREIDYGLLGRQPFFCVSGTGFDARIGHVFADLEGRGFLNYAKAAIVEYFKYKPKKYKLTIDGKKRIKRRAFLITFANASQYGNNAYIAPNADVCDGLMDVCILRPFHFFRSFELLYSMFGKKLDKSNLLEIIQCREAELVQKKARAVHYDGEPAKARKKIHVKLVGGGLKVLVPG